MRKPLIQELIDFDERNTMFRHAVRFVDYEQIPGDILEFGTYTGRSLALLSHYHEQNKRSIHVVKNDRKVAGFDSFKGLPSTNGHPRWRIGMFSQNHSYHPFCPTGAKVTPLVVFRLFKRYRLPKPEIEVGDFNETMPVTIGTKYKFAAVVHIDCDLYESTKSVLWRLDCILQPGTVLMFDDWFNFKGSAECGEQKAFHEFKKRKFTEYCTYATFGKAFIVK